MRKQLLFGAITVFGLAFSIQATAQQQQFKCGNPEQLRKLYADNPQLELDQQKLVQRYNQAKLEKADSNFVYIIPVVFHIVHEYGSENISDAQIYDQMAILNEDYRKLNSDTSSVIPEYQALIANAKIEFRLATIDPFGNCTNGIDRIYSHQTNNADDFSKINQWQRDEYLNFWVTKSIGEPGSTTAGYAYYPSSTTGGFFFADGIIILHDYIGSIGTGISFRSRALTHEIGHYLGLAHTWGNTNEPTVACGDDGIIDTPITKGHEYSYCSYMFTLDQSGFMRYNLDQTTAGRNNLYTPSNMALTGIDVLAPPTCAPVADFTIEDRTVCVGDNITFKNASWKGTPTSYEWSFPGGSPATSTSTNPIVSYSEPGYYSATLTATNAAGSNTKTFTNVVYASATYTENFGPAIENFNQEPNFWISINPENNLASFTKINTNGIDNSGCYRLNNYFDDSNAQLYTPEWFYNNRLGNSRDYLVSPSYNLSTTTNVQISFDYSFGSKSADTADFKDKLVFSVSNDCGKNWSVKKTLTGTELITSGYVGNTNFAPTSNFQWKTYSTTYNAGSNSKTRFRFEFIATDESSNLYIDNFNITGTLGVSENELVTAISLSPNPVNSGSDISVEIEATDMDMTIQVVDLNGAIVSSSLVKATNGAQIVQIPMNVSKGYYILNAIQGNAKSTHKVVVF